MSGDEQISNSEQINNIAEFGQQPIEIKNNPIHCISVIGQIEGHVLLPPNTKSTKYEHILPLLVSIEQSDDIEGFIMLMNTVGGDVEAGLAIAETIAGMKKPCVSLVLGGGHSIGVPLAVSARYSFITPTATVTLHPIRMSGMVVGAPQTYDYIERMHDRIARFIVRHSGIKRAELNEMMLRQGGLANELGTVLVGKQAVDCGLINEVGGLDKALRKLKRIIKEKG